MAAGPVGAVSVAGLQAADAQAVGHMTRLAMQNVPYGVAERAVLQRQTARIVLPGMAFGGGRWPWWGWNQRWVEIKKLSIFTDR